MIRLRLLASSMSPLLIILGIRLWPGHTFVALTLLVVAVVAIGSLLLLMSARDGLSRQRFVLTTVKDESDQVPAYLVTYLLPFLTFTISSSTDLISYVVLAAVLIVLVIRTDLVYVQPVLLMAGWHLYRGEVKNGYGTKIFITNLSLKVGQEVLAVGTDRTVSRVTQQVEE